jgi:hypothetical protein
VNAPTYFEHVAGAREAPGPFEPRPEDVIEWPAELKWPEPRRQPEVDGYEVIEWRTPS